MLKLCLPGTETQYLPASSDRAPCSPALYNAIADFYCALCTGQGKNRKNQTKVISDHVHNGRIVAGLSHLIMSQERMKVWCQHLMWETISSTLPFTWFPQCPDPSGQLSVTNASPLLNLYRQSIHEKGPRWHQLNSLLPSRLLSPPLLCSHPGQITESVATHKGLGFFFANAAVSHLTVPLLGLAGLTDMGTKLTHRNRKEAQRKGFPPNIESLYYKYVATVLNTKGHHGLTVLGDCTTVTKLFYLPQLNGDSKEGVNSRG